MDGERLVPRTYGAVLGVVVACFFAAAAVLAVSFPFHEWDAFAFGDLSRAVAAGDVSVDDFTPAELHRAFYYVVQGGLWSLTGVSFTAGRLLGLVFSALLLVGVVRLADAGASRLVGLVGAVAGLMVIAIPEMGRHVVSGLSDVPAAAMVALTAAVALTTRGGRWWSVGLGVLAAMTLLTKPSTLAPLAGLVVAVAIATTGERLALDRERLRRAGPALAVGVAVGLLVDLVLALERDVGLFAFLTAGSGGSWADRADAERWDSLLRGDVLGEHLRLPVAFALVYGGLRVVGLAHRVAGLAGLAGAVLWTTVIASFADPRIDQPRDLWTPESVFTWVAFLALLAATALRGEAFAPSRGRVLQLLLISVPPLLAWWWFTAYHPRLASTAWPGLCALVAACLAAGIEALRRSIGVGALAPLAALLVAVWASFGVLDGIHGDQWREVRSLGIAGLRDEQRTLNIVNPGLDEALRVVGPVVGDEGRLYTADPVYDWWFPGRVEAGYATRCEQLEGFSAFILLTGDEAVAQLEELGGSGDPGWWEACERPRLRRLEGGEDKSFAAFAVEG